MPNMYARGILFGKMVIELGDTCTVRNGAQDLHADIEFKTKGFFSGTYNALAGRVKHGSNELGEVMGKWSALMEFKTAKVRLLTLNHIQPPLFTLTPIPSSLTSHKTDPYTVHPLRHHPSPCHLSCRDDGDK
jgi:Oxysterol-binding protein